MGEHFPVMLDEVLECLKPQAGGVYVDGTFGAGGYSRAILELADCTVIAIDRDPNAETAADDLKNNFGERFIFIKGCFGDALELVQAAGFEQVDGFVLDIGVSSMQLDEAERGFSFRFDGPLDMRMGQEGQSAEDLVNDLPGEDLANIIYKYGEERLSRRIAKNIVRERAESRVETTQQLAEIIRAVVPRSPKDKIDPATRTFQALRIVVNDELGELERGLKAAQTLLKDQGRLVVVSFHSLEDGIVKSFLYERAGYVANASRHLPPNREVKSDVMFTLPKRKPIEASQKEIEKNARSRSAKLRYAVRKRGMGNV